MCTNKSWQYEIGSHNPVEAVQEIYGGSITVKTSITIYSCEDVWWLQ